jgi:TonB family protein
VEEEKEEMIEQEPVEDEAPPDEPADTPPDLPSTGISGPGGPDGFGLRAGSGSSRGGTGGSGGQRSRWGWYASQVQSKIGEAMRSHRKVKNASLRVEVRIWPNATGRITRAQLAGSTGDPALDAALRDEVLTGLQLSQPPPEGMPSPIVLRLSARRP